MNSTALMACGYISAKLGLVVALQQDFFTTWRCHIARSSESTDYVVRIRLGGDVANKDVRRLGKIRGDRHTNKAALPGRIHRQFDEWRREQLVILEDSKRSSLLAYEDAAIRSNLQRGRPGQPGHD